MEEKFNHINRVKGELFLPGDKSISHRAVIFSAMAKGKTLIKNLSESEDVKSTISCLQNLGAEFTFDRNRVEVDGTGYLGFSKPTQPLYAGNSGTTTRLLTGLLSAQKFDSVITGDDSLSSRPMNRITTPLRMMGAYITDNDGKLPLQISNVKHLNSIAYQLPVASAQLKSCLLIAGLHCDEETCLIEDIPTRNHTELLLGLSSTKKAGATYIYSSKRNYPVSGEYIIPSDISTAAFFIVLTLLSKDSELILKNVSLNETRTGILKVLRAMGGNIEIISENTSNNEKYGDLRISSSKLVNVPLEASIIPNIIDEIPILAVAGLFAEGVFKIRNALELRMKESDRIKSVCSNFRQLGLQVEEFNDGFIIGGSAKNKKVIFESFGDHRIAMAFSIFSLLLEEGGKINNFECVKISNPNFISQLKSICR